MIIENKDRAERKLTQVGYYRLSGYWYPCRKQQYDAQGKQIICGILKTPTRHEELEGNVTFENVFDLYLFDKKIRLMLLDAIERIEIHIRSVIAHEIGRYHPMAYTDETFINPKFNNKFGWQMWEKKQDGQIKRSHEDYIKWHKNNQKPIPFWVAVEAWDFGTTSKYYSMLKGKYQQKICDRLDIDNQKVLKTWLHQINIIRNRCAHHSRIWNNKTNNKLPTLDNSYFNSLQLSDNSLSRLYGVIAVIWFMVEKIGSNSQWLNNIAMLINQKPDLASCSYSAMGFDNELGFPLGKFTS